jgi:3-hydroxyacyl-CoA dehydrogenase
MTVQTSYDNFDKVEMVIEAIFEDIDLVKYKLIKETKNIFRFGKIYK